MKMKKNVILIFLLALTATLALAGCDTSKKTNKLHIEETTPEAVTVYTPKTEAYVEYGPFVAGVKGMILVHLTRRSDFKPVADGNLTIESVTSKGEKMRVAAQKTESPGIYRAETVFPAPGNYKLDMVIAGTGFTDRLDISIDVLKKDDKPAHHDNKAIIGEKGKHDEHDHDTESEHDHENEHKNEKIRVVNGRKGSIIFTKEQQWQLDFMVETPIRRTLSSSFGVMGELVPVSSGEAVVAAPLFGIVSVHHPLPYLGQRVSKGKVIAVIEPPVQPNGGIAQLTAEHAQAKIRLNLAKREHDRVRKLVEAKIAPGKRLEEAEASLTAAVAALEPLENALKTVNGTTEENRITVRAPISGTVVEVATVMGKGIEAGQPLVRIVDTSTVWLKANIPAGETGKVGRPTATGTTFTLTGLTETFTPSGLVSISDMVDPRTRTLPVLFAVSNPKGLLKVGMFATVLLRTGQVRAALAIPKEALFEDEGHWFVFVQSSAERFDRREVKTGIEDTGFVQILDGLRPDDLVVTKGGYYVKLTGQGGAIDPHAGHAH